LVFFFFVGRNEIARGTLPKQSNVESLFKTLLYKELIAHRRLFLSIARQNQLLDT